jgi:DNA-binding FrmR family transcriptional regulator
VRAALNSVTQVIVDDLVQDCLASKQRKGPMEEALLELKAVVASI